MNLANGWLITGCIHDNAISQCIKREFKEAGILKIVYSPKFLQRRILKYLHPSIVALVEGSREWGRISNGEWKNYLV